MSANSNDVLLERAIMSANSNYDILSYDPNKLIKSEKYENFDYIIRAKASSVIEKLKIEAITPTSTFTIFFTRFFDSIKKERDVFIKTIKWQKHMLDYNSHYTSFLLGSVNEKEFLKISKDYIIKHENYTDIKTLSENIFILIDATKLSFLTQELSNIFQCKEDNILKAMNLIIKEEKDLT